MKRSLYMGPLHAEAAFRLQGRDHELIEHESLLVKVACVLAGMIGAFALGLAAILLLKS